MKFEQYPNTSESEVIQKVENAVPNTAGERDIKRQALELERLNMNVEEMEAGEARDTAIERVEALNEQLAALEAATGLSEATILSEYEHLTQEAAEKGIMQLIEELAITDTEKQKLLREAREGSMKFFDRIKTIQPNKVAFAAACFLIISASATAYAESPKDTQTHHGSTYHVSMQAPTLAPTETVRQTDRVESAQEVTEILRRADERAKVIIENVEGFIKALAQKKVVDTIADNKAAILASIDDLSRENPHLGNDAAQKLFEVYKGTIQEIDKLNDGDASEKIRGALKEKIELIGTKNYSKIKKELLG